MSILLWLDDNRSPEDPEIRKMYQLRESWLWVKTAGEAIQILKSKVVSYISFDHDLGTPETGYDVAKWIEEQAYYGNIPKLKWDIHSSNPVGSKAIQQAMQSADRYWS